MVKKSFVLLLVCFIVCFCVGCDRFNVERVRQGTLDFDTTKTVGDALSKTGVLRSPGKWIFFKATDGSDVVQFNSSFPNLQEALDQQLAELKDSPEATALAALATGSEFGAVGLAMLLHSPLRIKKCEYQIQFVLSKRDDSYVIGQSELKAEIHNVQTGQTQTFVFSDNDGEVLEAIYSGNRADVAFYVLGQAMQAEIAGNLLRELREQ